MNNNENIYGLLVPHAPTLLEDELHQRPSPVIEALRTTGRELQEWGVEAVVAVSTHWQTGERFYVDQGARHATITDYYGFEREISYDVAGHPVLAQQLLQAGLQDVHFVAAKQRGVDHAVTIPLYFMFPDKQVPVVPLSIAQSPLEAFRWGRTLGRSLREWGRKVLFMASGSLAHDLASFARGVTLPEHGAFDQAVLQLLRDGKGMDVLELPAGLVHAAKPEGGFRDLMMLLGVMGANTTGRQLAYEQTAGVGLGVVAFTANSQAKGVYEDAGNRYHYN